MSRKISKVVGGQLLIALDKGVDAIWYKLDQEVDENRLGEIVEFVQHSMEQAISEISRKVEVGDLN